MANLSVTYNGLTMCPTCDILTPFVTRSSKYEYDGKKKRRVTTININGKITGDDFDTINARRSLILTAFSKDFQPLTAGNYSFARPKVDEVSFSEGNTGVIEFTISLTDYDAYFVDAGLHDVQNEWTLEEGEDGVITCRHVISARGSRYSGSSESYGDERDAILSAKNYCHSLAFPNVSPANVSWRIDDGRGWAGFASVGFGGTPWSISYNYNRVTGAYVIEETWKQGKWSASGFVENYDISESYSIEDKRPTIDVSYSIQTGVRFDQYVTAPETWLSKLRDQCPSVATLVSKVNDSLNFGLISHATFDEETAIAPPQQNAGLNGITFQTVGETPLTYEVTEHDGLGSTAGKAKIEIKMTLDHWYYQRWSYVAQNAPDSYIPYQVILDNYYNTNNSEANYSYLDYQISHSNDYLSQITTVDITCTLKCARGPLNQRAALLVDWYNQDWVGVDLYKNLWALAKVEYEYAHSGNNWGGTGHSPSGTKLHQEPNGQTLNLHPEPLNISEKYDPTTGETTFTATYDNRDWLFTTKSEHDSYWVGVGNMNGNNPWNELSSNFAIYPHKTYQWDVTEKLALAQAACRMGANGNMHDPDYLFYLLGNCSKGVTSINTTTDIAAGFYGWMDTDTMRVQHNGLGKVIQAVELGRWENTYLYTQRRDKATTRVLENWELTKSKIPIGSPLTLGCVVGGVKLNASVTWAQSTALWLGQMTGQHAGSDFDTQVVRGHWWRKPSNR
jgi:hypothetical protein